MNKRKSSLYYLGNVHKRVKLSECKDSLRYGIVGNVLIDMCFVGNVTIEDLKNMKENGVDMNSISKCGNNALYYALNINPRECIIEKLIEYGCDVNLKCYMGSTPFHILCRSNVINIELLDMFLERCHDLNSVNNYGKSPLYYAMYNKKVTPEMIEYMMQNGCRDTQVDIDKVDVEKGIILVSYEYENYKKKVKNNNKFLDFIFKIK